MQVIRHLVDNLILYHQLADNNDNDNDNDNGSDSSNANGNDNDIF